MAWFDLICSSFDSSYWSLLIILVLVPFMPLPQDPILYWFFPWPFILAVWGPEHSHNPYNSKIVIFSFAKKSAVFGRISAAVENMYKHSLRPSFCLILVIWGLHKPRYIILQVNYGHSIILPARLCSWHFFKAVLNLLPYTKIKALKLV